MAVLVRGTLNPAGSAVLKFYSGSTLVGQVNTDAAGNWAKLLNNGNYTLKCNDVAVLSPTLMSVYAGMPLVQVVRSGYSLYVLTPSPESAAGGDLWRLFTADGKGTAIGVHQDVNVFRNSDNCVVDHAADQFERQDGQESNPTVVAVRMSASAGAPNARWVERDWVTGAVLKSARKPKPAAQARAAAKPKPKPKPKPKAKK